MTITATLRRPFTRLDDGLTSLGGQLHFYGRAIGWSPRTLRRYKKEVLRLLAEVSLGTGALSVIGGTVGVIAFLAFFTGTEVGLQGYSALNQLGVLGVHRLRLGVLQHPRDRPAGGRAGAGRDRRLRLHRPARRDADQ